MRFGHLRKLTSSGNLCVIAQYAIDCFFKWRKAVPNPAVVIYAAFSAVNDFRVAADVIHQFFDRLMQGSRELAADG